jgi:hypothetical protein
MLPTAGHTLCPAIFLLLQMFFEKLNQQIFFERMLRWEKERVAAM